MNKFDVVKLKEMGLNVYPFYNSENFYQNPVVFDENLTRVPTKFTGKKITCSDFKEKIISDDEILKMFDVTHPIYVKHVINDLDDFNWRVIDFDVKDNPEKLELMNEFLSETFGQLNGSPICQTKSGGAHIWIKVKKGSLLTPNNKFYYKGEHCGEVLGVGNYVVCEDLLNSSGNKYLYRFIRAFDNSKQTYLFNDVSDINFKLGIVVEEKEPFVEGESVKFYEKSDFDVVRHKKYGRTILENSLLELEDSSEGDRNNKLFAISVKLFSLREHYYVTDEKVISEVTVIADQLGIEDSEIEQVLKSAKDRSTQRDPLPQSEEKKSFDDADNAIQRILRSAAVRKPAEPIVRQTEYVTPIVRKPVEPIVRKPVEPIVRKPVEPQAETTKINGSGHKSKVYMDKIIEFIETECKIRFNVVTQREEVYDKNLNKFIVLDDDKVKRMLREFSLYSINSPVPSRVMMENCIAATRVDFNPFTSYYDSLNKYDPKTEPDYIQILSDTVPVIPEEKNLWETIFKKWLVGIGATLLDKGINHQTVILCGDQGNYKTTFFNKLLPKELMEYGFSGYLNPKDKDSSLLACRKAIINLDEMEGSVKKDWTYLKSLVTSSTNTLREAYGKRAKDFVRYASFCGSINDRHLLGDLTGSRRFNVFDIKGNCIDINSVTEELIENVFRQAYYLLLNGFQYFTTKEEEYSINKNNEKYQIIRPELEAFHEMFVRHDSLDSDDDKEMFLNATQIIEKLTEITSIKLYPSVLGKLLNKNLEMVSKHGTNKYRLKYRSKLDLMD